MIWLIRRQFGICALLIIFAIFMRAMSACADVSITEPVNGAIVRGETTAHFAGIPDGGYLIVNMDGNFIAATAQLTFEVNTFSPATFGLGAGANTDGQHQLSITGVDASGKHTSTASTTFTVSNNQVDLNSPSVLFTHWVPAERLDEDAQRYRVLAESTGLIDGYSGGRSTPQMIDGVMYGEPKTAFDPVTGREYPTAPLDWQYTALLRSTLRDVNMFNDTANIKTIIQQAFERQRLSEGNLNTAKDESNTNSLLKGLLADKNSQWDISVRAPWSDIWSPSFDNDIYFVRSIKQDGEEVNATRKNAPIAVAELLPTFPDTPLQPGARWNAKMTFLNEVQTQKPFRVIAPMTFTKYEDITLPSGEVRRAAKLETNFELTDEKNKNLASNIAAVIAIETTNTAGSRNGVKDTYGSRKPGEMTAFKDMDKQRVQNLNEDLLKKRGAIWEQVRDENQIEEFGEFLSNVKVTVSRVIWFDMQAHRLLLQKDDVNISFRLKEADTQTKGDSATQMSALPNVPDINSTGENNSPVESNAPTFSDIDYSAKVTTWYDDSIPPPTLTYNGGKGTPHSKDNVQEPSLSKVTGKF